MDENALRTPQPYAGMPGDLSPGRRRATARKPQTRLIVPREAAPEPASEHPFHPDHVACARKMLRIRKIVAQHIPRNVSRDSFWDIAFDLFVCNAEGRHPCVKQVIIASGETSTTALRQIDRLEAAELIERVPDGEDHRRSLIRLSPKGVAAMTAILESILLAGRASSGA